MPVGNPIVPVEEAQEYPIQMILGEDFDFNTACETSEPESEEQIAQQVEAANEWLAEQAEAVVYQRRGKDSGLKMYAIFSQAALKAMKGNRGKMAAQAGHAYLHAWWDALGRHPDLAYGYRGSSHAYKIALAAPADADEAWFAELAELYREKTGVTEVIDAGFTVFDGPTFTCIGIGPINPDDREPILCSLRPLT